MGTGSRGNSIVPIGTVKASDFFPHPRVSSYHGSSGVPGRDTDRSAAGLGAASQPREIEVMSESPTFRPAKSSGWVIWAVQTS